MLAAFWHSICYLTVGSHNMDYRCMMMDGDVRPVSATTPG